MTVPATDWKEEVTPGEAERFERHAEFLRELQRKNDAKSRGLHAKQNLGLTAELTIDDGLPAHARQGLAAKPAKYPAYVRVSNGGAKRQHDKKGDIRGFAVKVVGVDGKKVIPGMENARTQDFLCIHTPVTSVANADEFMALVRALQTPALLLPRLIGAIGFGRTLKVLGGAAKAVGVKVASVATTTYYTAAPISWGPYAVRLGWWPRQAADPGAKPGTSPDYLGEELTRRVQAGPLSWDLKIQFYTDAASTPIEANDVDWPSEWVKIGTLVLPQQDPTSDRGRKVQQFVERASFDPWHALVEHRPLGNVMRARNVAYRVSTQQRGAAKEPDGSETF